MSDKILEVKNLQVLFRLHEGEVQAVRGISFGLNRGETLAIIGESGCGKSVTAQTIMRLLPMPPAVIQGGSVLFDGHLEIMELSDSEMERIRGAQIGMIFQDPMTALNPTMKIGKQIAEGLVKHRGLNRQAALERAAEMLAFAGIPNPDLRLRQYPHQLSGGMRQRVMIATALACGPRLLIADEPTTALDVTTQAAIIELMKDFQAKTGTSILLVTHDPGIVAEMAHRVAVMYAGKILEQGTVREIFYHSRHPYTWGLLSFISRPDNDFETDLAPALEAPPLLSVSPKGCAFAEICPYTMGICLEEEPEHAQISPSHSAACWLNDPGAPKIRRPGKGEGEVRG